MRITRLSQAATPQAGQIQAAQAAIQNVAGMLEGTSLQTELVNAISPEILDQLLKDIVKNIQQMPTLSNAMNQLVAASPDLEAEKISGIMTAVFGQALIDNKATMEQDLKQAIATSISKYINMTDIAIQSQNGLTTFLGQTTQQTSRVTY